MMFLNRGWVFTVVALSSLLFADPARSQQQIAQANNDAPSIQGLSGVEADVLYYESVNARLKNNNKEAEEMLLKVIKINPDAAGAYYDLARVSMLLNKPDKATEYIKKAVVLQPANLWYKGQLAEILVARNQFDEAADIYKQLATSEKYNREYLTKSMMLFMHTGKSKEALEAVNKLLEKDPDDEEMVIRKQQLLLKLNDFDGAIAVIRQFSDKNPQEGKYLAVLAEMYDNNKQPEKAVEIYKKAEQRFPGDPYIQISLSKYYHNHNDNAKYREYAGKAIVNKTLNTELQLQGLIEFVQQAGEDTSVRKEAAMLAAEVARQHKGDAQVQALYGDIMSLNNDAEKAVAQYKIALDIDPSMYKVWQNLLYNYTNPEGADSLLHYSEKAIRLFPNQAILHYLRGVAYMNKKNYTPAIKSIQRGIDMMPEDTEAQLVQMQTTLGDVYNQSKQYTLSDSAYEKALRLDPNNASALNNYSYYLSMRGVRLDDAERMSKRSLDARPGEATFLDTYGWILYKQGKYEKAREYIQKAVDANPAAADATLWDHMGDVYFKLNNSEKALECWKRAKEKGTDNTEIDKKINGRKLYE